MRRFVLLPLLCGVVVFGLAAETPNDREARAAANTFGQALQEGDSSRLRSLMPTKGKVRLRLMRLGNEQGSFSAGQVQSLLQDFLRQGSVESFEAVGVEHDPGVYALVRCRARIIDREGRHAETEIHLDFEPEGQHWVLRSIRESPP